MTMKSNKSKRTKWETPGPKPEVLKINGNWKKAITESFKKKKPSVGWPK
jgi:hypothetical protein